MAEENAAEKKDSPFTLALLAGGCAGTSVDVALHPLDTLRTRMQSPAGFWKAGGFKGVYRGILSATLGSAPGAALFFSTYETMKQVLKRTAGDQETPMHHAVASSCGEVAACLIRVPTAVVTQRMQVGQFGSFSEAVGQTFKGGGIRAFYVGYGTTVMREIPFAFIQFPIYERLKCWWSTFQGHETNPVQGAVCGSLAGAVAGACTTPLDVAKTRIMLETREKGEKAKYTGTVTTLRTIAAEEGVPMLFKGITPRVTWITIGGFIFFGAYESATKMLWSTGVW
uniref:Mitochondrial carrier protein n=1 Tax=Alexandrium catenella TaxID=2925 RepID=A0A7S1KYI3_ALECA